MREKLQNGLLSLFSVPTQQQLADIFTKALEPTPFQKNLSKLGVNNIYSSVCRGVLNHIVSD
jgi:hypothetical protein